MTESTPPNTCADCGGALVDITVFSRSSANPISGAAMDCEMVYSLGANAERSSFLSMFKLSGTLHAYMCDECHRVSFYAHPKK